MLQPSGASCGPACSSIPAALAVYQQGKHPLLQCFPAWTEGARPASSREQAILWHLPLNQLQSAVEEVLQTVDTTAEAKCVDKYSSTHVLQGQQLAVRALMTKVYFSSSDAESCQLELDLDIECQQLPPNAVRQMSAQFRMASNN